MHFRDQRGQTLLIIIFMMLISLSIGLGVSSTFFKTVRHLADTNSSTRALAIAEAAVERLLLFPVATLESFIDMGNCGGNCQLSITGEDGIVASASVQLEYIGKSTEPLPLNLSVSEISEVNLQNYPNNTTLRVCWDDQISGENPSVVALMYYGTSGSYLVDNYAVNSGSSLRDENGFAMALSHGAYSNCFTVEGRNSPQFLRLKSVYNSADVYIVPSNGSVLPSQGVVMTSTGSVNEISRKVVVKKTLPVLPEEFDYAIFQKSLTDTLSN
jgi:hypothetical protein